MTPTRRSSSRHLPAKSLLTALACAITVAAGPGEASAGGLLFVEYEAESDPPVNALRRAEDVAVSPDGTNLYTVDSMLDAIGVFTRNPATGELTFLESHQETPANSIGLAADRNDAEQFRARGN